MSKLEESSESFKNESEKKPQSHEEAFTIDASVKTTEQDEQEIKILTQKIEHDKNQLAELREKLDIGEQTENIPSLSKQQSKLTSLERKVGFEKIKDKARSFFKRIRQASFILVLAGITDYQLTHNNQIDSINTEGKEFFKHSDPETTHILNYLSGLDSLSNEENLEFIKNGVRGYIFTEKAVFPENFDEMSYDETLNYIVKVFTGDTKDPDRIKKCKESFTKSIEDYLPKKHDYNDTIYKKIWQVEKECGSPKIRWTFGHDRHVLDGGTSISESRYNAFTHTVYIGAEKNGAEDTQLEKLISEWAHSKQFDDSPFGSTIQAIEDGARIGIDILKSEHHDYTISQNKEYEIPGSIEYDAHKIIEPYLKEKFKEIKSLNLEH